MGDDELSADEFTRSWRNEAALRRYVKAFTEAATMPPEHSVEPLSLLLGRALFRHVSQTADDNIMTYAGNMRKARAFLQLFVMAEKGQDSLSPAFGKPVTIPWCEVPAVNGPSAQVFSGILRAGDPDAPNVEVFTAGINSLHAHRLLPSGQLPPHTARLYICGSAGTYGDYVKSDIAEVDRAISPDGSRKNVTVFPAGIVSDGSHEDGMRLYSRLAAQGTHKVRLETTFFDGPERALEQVLSRFTGLQRLPRVSTMHALAQLASIPFRYYTKAMTDAAAFVAKRLPRNRT